MSEWCFNWSTGTRSTLNSWKAEYLTIFSLTWLFHDIESNFVQSCPPNKNFLVEKRSTCTFMICHVLSFSLFCLMYGVKQLCHMMRCSFEHFHNMALDFGMFPHQIKFSKLWGESTLNENMFWPWLQLKHEKCKGTSSWGFCYLDLENENITEHVLKHVIIYNGDRDIRINMLESETEKSFLS